MTSRKPAVQRRAVLAPFLSITALATSVVAWASRSAADAERGVEGPSSVRPASIARAGSSGVVNRFAVRTRPVSVSIRTKSVNVPPMSQPMRNPCAMASSLLLRNRSSAIALECAGSRPTADLAPVRHPESMDRTHLAYSASVATREVSRGKDHVSLRRLQAYVTSIEPYGRQQQRGSGRREGSPVFKAHVPQDRDP